MHWEDIQELYPRLDPQLRVLFYQDAMVKFRNAYGLAKRLGITPAAVYQWHGLIPWDRMEQVQGLLLESDEPARKGPKRPRNGD